MSVEIIFKEKKPDLFWQYWQKFISKYEVSPKYLKVSIEYGLAYAKNIYLDKSFVYIVDGQPLACVFLPIEKNDKNLSATFVNSYINAPLFTNYLIAKKVFKIIDVIAKENLLTKIMFSIDSLQCSSYNYLQKYNYLDTSILNYVIDLTTDDLLAHCRKGCRNEIKHVLKDKDFSVFYIDKKNSSYEIHEEYRKLHHKCAGRVTRSKETFDFQYQLLKQGKAVLFGLRYKKKNIAYSYFNFNTDKAIYASSADDPDYDKLPLYHILIFSAMKWLRKNGIKYLDTQQPSAPSLQLDHYPDKKQLNIALFKRGFGGEFRMEFRGIKYFSREAFKNDAKKFINNYSNIDNIQKIK